MRLSTSTNITESIYGEKDYYTIEQSIDSCVLAGYKVMDMNFHSMSRNGILTREDWLDWVKRIKDYSDRKGVEYSQSHIYFYNPCEDGITDGEFREELTRRSIIASGILGVKWAVMHPPTVKDDEWYNREKSLRYNLDWFSRWGELARKHNVGIAIENMIGPKRGGRFAISSEDLIELVDTIKDKNIGICWDFGHANLRGVNQVAALKNIGKRLKATHVNDNFGETDQHFAPYFGTIEWEPIMHTLAEIGYEGDFTFEIHNFTGCVPGQVHQNLVQFSYDLGQYMLSMISKDKN